MRPFLFLSTFGIIVLLVASAAVLVASQIPFDMPIHSLQRAESAPHTKGVSADVQSSAPSTAFKDPSAKPVGQPWSSRAVFALSGPVSLRRVGEPNLDQSGLGPPALTISPGLADRGISVRGAPGSNNVLDGPLADLDEPGADDAFENDHIRGRPRFSVKRGARLQDGRATIFDVSEGTALDPLQDRSWDLNSSKIVPGVQNEPGDNHGNPPVASAAPTKAPKLKKVRAPSE
jgi:hypothetical protein